MILEPKISGGGVDDQLRAISPIEARFLDDQLAYAMRDACRFGFHEASHLIACARQSILDQVPSEHDLPEK